MTDISSHPPSSRGVGHWAIMLVAAVTAILGVVLLVGGVYLIWLGGSWYYAPAGLGLILTAALLFVRRAAAVLIYALVWILTLVWTIWEVQFDWWAWTPRMVAPTVLLVFILLCLPGLHLATRKRRSA